MWETIVLLILDHSIFYELICHYYDCSDKFISRFGLVYVHNRPPFRMEYRHLTKFRGTKKLLWNWNISIFQLLMDCLIYNDMKSYNKQWNTLPQLWNLLISIFHSSMEFHGTHQKFHGIPWNSMELFGVKREVPWNSMELWKFHGTWCQHQIPWNSMESPHLE